MTNEVQDSVVVDERLSSPVIADRGEQAMFDGIPLWQRQSEVRLELAI